MLQESVQIGAKCHAYHRWIVVSRQIGLAKAYTVCEDLGSVRLHELRTAMYRASLTCYGWDGADPDLGVYQNDGAKRGLSSRWRTDSRWWGGFWTLI